METSESEELRLLRKSFSRVYVGSDKLRHEYDLRNEARLLGLDLEDYRQLYERWANQAIPFSGHQIWNWMGIKEKKLWDIVQLLTSISIPVILFLGGQYFTSQTNDKQQNLADNRQQEETLNNYFDQMTKLLLERNLNDPQKGIESQKIARTRSLTALRQLNGERKGLLVKFLNEAELISDSKPVIRLNSANLTQVNLVSADLLRVDLADTDLSNANLTGANLTGANLTGANLTGANLTGANLTGANLTKANLTDVDLTRTTLVDSKLMGIDLKKVNLADANLTGADLKGASLPKDFPTNNPQVILCDTKPHNGTEDNYYRDCTPSVQEQFILALINQHRTTKELPPMSLDASITAIAKAHSEAMAQGKVPFSHKGFHQRIEVFSKLVHVGDAARIAENIAYNNSSYNFPARQAFLGWLRSPGHLNNIEGPYDLTGVGIASDGEGKYYITQIYVRSIFK